MKTIILADDGTNFEEFENAIPEEARPIWDDMQEQGANGLDYFQLRHYQQRLEPYGITFDYGLDAQPIDMKLTLED